MQFQNLLEQFGERCKKADSLENAQAVNNRQLFESLLNGYDEAVERHRQQQEEAIYCDEGRERGPRCRNNS
jgi:hypothetical protein